MKKISEVLNKKQSSTFNFKNSDQYHFYVANKRVLNEIKTHNPLNSGFEPFDIICKNAIISSILNKKHLDFICKDLFSSIYLNSKLTSEEFLKYYHARIVDLKSFQSNGKDIVMPVFSHVLNDIYLNNPLELLKPPYSEIVDNLDGNLIDLFATYNYKLFDSNFTKLVKIKEYEDVCAFYDFDSATILFINDQGRLDYFLSLYDKWMDKINTSHLLNRLEEVTDAFYNNDKIALINALRSNNLISNKMKDLLLNKCIEK